MALSSPPPSLVVNFFFVAVSVDLPPNVAPLAAATLALVFSTLSVDRICSLASSAAVAFFACFVCPAMCLCFAAAVAAAVTADGVYGVW